jgi:hypothetical protein
MLFELEGTDHIYAVMRRPRTEYENECRSAFERLFTLAIPFLDDELELRLRRDFHSVYWEVLVAASLLESGAKLVPRTRRTPRKSGPDLLSEAPLVWIEVATVTPGIGPDAVPQPATAEAYSVPDDQILLRLIQAIVEKRGKHKKYLDRGWLRPTDPYLVAINPGTLPSGKSELPLPRIVRAVFPFGHFTVSMDNTTSRITESYYQYRPAITKALGATVSTSLFDDPAFAAISGCLYSVADVFNPPRTLSGSMILVHNPLALARLPQGAFSGMIEYWRDGDVLHCSER